jgi:hypothetical protein
MKKPNILLGVLGLVISLGVVYGYTYVIGKSWKASQK